VAKRGVASQDPRRTNQILVWRRFVSPWLTLSTPLKWSCAAFVPSFFLTWRRRDCENKKQIVPKQNTGPHFNGVFTCKYCQPSEGATQQSICPTIATQPSSKRIKYLFSASWDTVDCHTLNWVITNPLRTLQVRFSWNYGLLAFNLNLKLENYLL